MSELINIQLIIIIGQYAIKYHLPDAKDTLTNLVKTQNYEENKIILPPPSPRNNNIWLKKNEWYINDVLPQLKTRVKDILDASN